MNKGFISSIGLIVKVLVVLALPLFLFSFVDTQPTKVTEDDEDDEGTRSVAVVNEDTGHVDQTEEIVLGQNITSVLKEQDDYSWKVVNRSAAEEGFDNEEYDAILYVPSSFSENIMTFKDESPSKASINYVVQPNIEAKERQRIHREMANAKNAINHEMSTIYWSYVSQEVDNVRDQFDKILEKEIAFQDAMYSFYTPSSETLAKEINSHKDRLEGILEQTNRLDEASIDNVSSATEAESQMKEFTEALDAYKEGQSDQEKLLSEFQTENEELVADGIDAYTEAVENSMKNMEEKHKEQSEVVRKQGEKLQKRFGTMNGKLAKGHREIGKLRNSLEDSSEQEDNFKKLTGNIVDEILDESIAEAEETFKEAYDAFKDTPIVTFLEGPEKPDEGEFESLTFDQLEASLELLEEEIEAVKNEVGDLESGLEDEQDPINWDEVTNNLEMLQGDVLEDLKERSAVKKDVALENIENWKEYADLWIEKHDIIKEELAESSTLIAEKVDDKQDSIVNHDALSKDQAEKLEEQFTNLTEIENKPIISLVDYSEALSAYEMELDQKHHVEKELSTKMKKDFEGDIEELFSIDDKHIDKLEEILGVPSSRSTFKSKEENKESVTKLIEKAEANLASSNESIQEAIEDNRGLVKEMRESANSVADGLSEVNAETFDWEEPSSVEQLDGRMVVEFQQGTASGLENLSELVSSLEDNQNNITADTEELQTTVGSVQDESDELNNRWSSNIENTEQVQGDVYDVLGNTVVDGQFNPYVYDHLSNPVSVEGQVDGKVLSESEDRMPPVVLFMIILLSGLLIGFLTQYYSSNSYLVQGGLFALLTLAVGLIISIYGLNIYPLDDSQAIVWSAFTILLLMACANIVRAGLFVGPFIGWLASLVMIMFFISPLLNIVVSEFSFTNPISNVYMGLLYGSSSSYVLTMIGLVLVILLMSALIYTLQVMRGKAKAEEPNEEQAS